MNDSIKPLLNSFSRKEKKGSLPFWFMRQAGRYLPEYKQIRSTTKDFLDMCYTPSKASEVTLQPIRRFGMSGAIIFSDILVIPDALGVEVGFGEKGPVLTPVDTEQSLNKLQWNIGKLAPVYEALRLTKPALPSETTLIGFAGAPWTLACYIVQGKSDKDFPKVRTFALKNRELFSRLISLLTDCIIEHLKAQIEAGAEIVQLFDSWAGVLSENEFSQWVIAPTKRIVAEIKTAYPDVPVIGFPRQAGSKYADYAKLTRVDAVSIDSSVSLLWAKQELLPLCGVQGNLDPLLLAEDKHALLKQAKHIISILGGTEFASNAFVFNLGHGILPHTPVENVQALCDLIRSARFIHD